MIITIFTKTILPMLFYNLIIFILCNAGIAIVISRSSLTEPFRKKVESKKKTNSFYHWFNLFINCPLCVGFYTSIPVYFFVNNQVSISLNLLAFMFIGSFSAYFLNRISNIG